MDNDKYIEFARGLYQWFIKNDYKGNDPYQIDEKFFSTTKKLSLKKPIRKILKPFHGLIPQFLFSSLKKISHPN